MKSLYQLSLIAGLGVFVYFYFFNFDNMSETQLVNSILYWYLPLAFGLYGLIALRITNRMPDPKKSVLIYIFSGMDPLLLILVILLGISGLLGLLVLLVPLVIFKAYQPAYHLKVAVFGSGLLFLLLLLFFKVLWPSL